MRQLAVNSLIIVLAFSSITAVSATRAVAQTNRSKNFNGPPVDLNIGSHKFQIPKDYLFDYHHGQAAQTTFALRANLPTFSPFRSHSGASADYDSLVYVRISESRIPPVSKQMGGLFTDSTAKVRPGPSGLTEYLDTPVSASSDVYAAHLSGDQTYAIFCLKTAPRTCVFNAPFLADISLHYEFNRVNLGNWRGIHAGILSLLSSFEEE